MKFLFSTAAILLLASLAQAVSPSKKIKTHGKSPLFVKPQSSSASRHENTNARPRLLAQNTSLPSTSGGSNTSPTTVSSPSPAKDPSKDSSIFSAKTAIDYSSTTHREDNPDLSQTVDVLVDANLKIAGPFKARLIGIVTKEMNQKKETTVANTLLGVTIEGFKISESLKTTHAVYSVLSTNKDAQEIDRLKGGVRVNNGLSLEWNGLSLAYTLGIQRNFHEFNINAEDVPNVEWQLRQRLIASYEFLPKWSLSFLGDFNQGRTYGGFDRQSFFTDWSLEYAWNETLQFTAGVSNEGPAVKANGRDSNLSFYDDRSSKVHGGLVLAF